MAGDFPALALMAREGGGGVVDLEGLLGGLRLSEEEKVGLKGVWSSKSKEDGKVPQAVGKLFVSKPGNAEGMALTLGKIWCPRAGIRCKDLGNNLFLFSFLQPGGKRRAITEGPWEFGGDLLIVVDFDESMRLRELEFTHTPVWIRVYDLPLGMMNVETSRRIGNLVGKFLEVDAEEDGSAIGKFLHVQVLLDVRKPLRRGILLEAEGGKPGWCDFKYEFIPNFCYACGILGHVEKECDEQVSKGGVRQYGEWLRVVPIKKRSGADLRYGRHESGGSGGSQQRSAGSGGRESLGKGLCKSDSLSLKASAVADPELLDDGLSPVRVGGEEKRGGKPKKLTWDVDDNSREALKEGHRPSVHQEVVLAGEV